MQSADSLNIPLLSGLTPEEQQQVLGCMTLVELAEGTILFDEGDPGDSLYIITSGSVEIIKAMGSAEEHLLAVHEQGSFIGEVALLDMQGNPPVRTSGGTDRSVRPSGGTERSAQPSGGVDRSAQTSRGVGRSAAARARGQATLLQMTAADFHRLMQSHPALALQMTRIVSNRLRTASDATIRDLEAKNRVLAQAYQELKEAHEQIIEKEKLEKELDIARQIQYSMLPEALPQAAGFSFGAHMQAARYLGGDFYDLFPLDENRIAVAVGDVSDKGVPAALYMALTRSLLRAEALRGTTPAQTLRQVNTLLQATSSSGQFVTVLFGVLDVRSARFDYARAGHELPILLRADGSLASISSTTGQILGMLDEVLIDEAGLQLEPGDRLLLFTDGATDAVDADNERFGHTRLAQELQNCPGMAAAGSHAHAQAVCDCILSKILGFQAGAPQFDDITLITIQRDRQ